MGRWRPPQPPSAPYITPEGYAALEQELKALWLRRREVVQALSAAAAEGARSETAEYIYRKKDLAGLDRRIRYLQKRLPDLTVVREHPKTDAVFFGATVDVLTLDGLVDLKIPPGTQPRDKLRLRGKGLPNPNARIPRGNQYVHVNVVVPKKLTQRQLQLLEQFDAESNQTATFAAAARNAFSRLASFISGGGSNGRRQSSG